MSSSPRRSTFAYSVQPLLDYAEQVKELLAERALLIQLLGVEQHHQVIAAIQQRIDLQDKKQCPPHFLIGLTGPKQQNIQSMWDSFTAGLASAEAPSALKESLETMALSSTIEHARDYYLARRLALKENPTSGTSRKRRFNR